MKFLAKWQLVLTAKKSCLISPPSSSHQTAPSEVINGLKFKELSETAYLGITTSHRGPYTYGHASEKLAGAISRLKAMAGLGLHPNGLRPDAANMIFDTMLLSVVKYGLGLPKPTSRLINLVDTIQTRFARNLLQLPISSPDRHDDLRAELGLVHLKFTAASAKLLMHHRILNHDEDQLTKDLISWMPQGTGGFLDDCASASTLLGPPLTPTQQAAMPYSQLAGALSSMREKAQLLEWNALAE
jgi:hypothetical protein